jgi:transcriptional regulator with XRE-family HTH domain
MSNAVYNLQEHALFRIGRVMDTRRARSLSVVQRLMDDHQLNRSDLARRLNVTPGAVTNWFRRGEVPVTAHRKIIDAFGVSADDLIDRPGHAAKTSVSVLPHRSVEAAQFAAEWDKLRDPVLRSQIRAMVEAAVKAQMDADRGKRGKDQGRDRPRPT